MYCVPLMRARPSLASSDTGVTPACFIASAARHERTAPRPAPRPRRSSRAPGARAARDRPTRPPTLAPGCAGARAARASRTARRRARAARRSQPERQHLRAQQHHPAHLGGTPRSGPMPVECERTRFFWSCRTSAAEMRVSLERAEPGVHAVDARPRRPLPRQSRRSPRATARPSRAPPRRTRRAAAPRHVLERLERQGAFLSTTGRFGHGCQVP